jgi:hypothetical protein
MPVSHLKLVLLSQGDTLVMRPGYPIAHAVVTLNSSIIVRGMLWPNSNLSQLTASLAYVLKNGKTTNKHVPKHLPEYIEAAISMGNRQVGDGIPGILQIILSRGDILALRQLKATLKPILLCACEEGICGEMCACANPNEQSRRLHHLVPSRCYRSTQPFNAVQAPSSHSTYWACTIYGHKYA